LDRITAILIERPEMLMLVALFLCVTTFTFAISSVTRSWSDIRRRVVAPNSESGSKEEMQSALILEDSNTGSVFDALLPTKESEKSELRRFLNMAGFYGKAAPVLYQLTRIISAVLVGLFTLFNYGKVFPNHPLIIAVGASMFMTLAGYMLPKTIISMRRDKLIEEHRQGFPDFLDLLVICIEAGISIDSGVERVSKDLGLGFPSLARNLQFMSLELRAGRSTRDSLENLSARLGISEAKSFAMLLQQSEELGSSLAQSLRVYSDEMREKRLSRAEEKAYALPAKLVIPLGLFIFPVIFGIVLVPVVLKIYNALGI
jgi:tight adherence protein C